MDPHSGSTGGAGREDLRVLSCCAGTGGMDLGIKLADPRARTVCYVEKEAYRAAALVQRMEDGVLDEAPVWTDVASFDGCEWRGAVDCFAAGFPCQPYSRAGRRAGSAHRQWLWNHLQRITREADPGLVFLENVDALRQHGGVDVVRDLVACGYCLSWDLYSARSVGATHSRPRFFLLAAKRHGLDHALRGRHGPKKGQVRTGWHPSFPASPRILREHPELRAGLPEPGLQRLPDGDATWLDRLAATGDGCVPAVACRAWHDLLDTLEGNRRQLGI